MAVLISYLKKIKIYIHNIDDIIAILYYTIYYYANTVENQKYEKFIVYGKLLIGEPRLKIIILPI